MSKTLPVVVFPLHDKDGLLFSHLQKITPDLKKIYEKVFISITPSTLELQKGSVKKLSTDLFFELVYNPPGTLVGEHFFNVFKAAAKKANPEQSLHLCTIDRLAYILETEHKNQFLKDISRLDEQNSPVLFQRSLEAWQTHPKNYYAAESMATRVGEIMLGKSLDFFWCHLVVKAKMLKGILVKIQNTHDFRLLAEIILALKDQLITKDASWLSWEDPYIFKKDPKKFKKERENDPAENEKRLAYTISTIELLLKQK